jgi:hypothetical protein
MALMCGYEDLVDWYPINLDDPSEISVAISQRSNASYANMLLRSTATAWIVALSAWLIFLVIVSLIAKLSLVAFLVGVFLPILPAFLDVVQYVTAIRKAAREHRDLAQSIEHRLKCNDEPIDGNDLVVWQSRMCDLRRSTPEVPDLIYKIKGIANERAMKSAAAQLGKWARRAKE